MSHGRLAVIALLAVLFSPLLIERARAQYTTATGTPTFTTAAPVEMGFQCGKRQPAH